MRDSRPDLFGVLGWDQPAKTISGSARVSASNCPAAVADPRFGISAGAHSNLYQVEGWGEAAHAVIGAANVHGGAPSIADPRIPAEDDRPDPVPVIIAEDGTWHRPLTTLELAALQGLPVFADDGSPLVLDGASHSAWRRRIGNAVPVGAAQAIAEEMLRTLLLSSSGATFALGSGGVWVHQDEEGMST
jgi:site-specific DNA-cytosine methylase